MVRSGGFEYIFYSLKDIAVQQCLVKMGDVFGGGFVIFRFQSPATTMVDWFACTSEKFMFFDFHDYSPMISLDSEAEGFIVDG